MKKITALLILCTSFLVAEAQTQLGDETALYAATKQVNQFFRRFNNEEDGRGKKYQKTDTRYRDNNKRREYLMASFDNQNRSLSPELKNKFIAAVTNNAKPSFLEFHGGRWFAEVRASFSYQNREEEITLFLELEEEDLGSKWVLTYAFFPPFNQLFYNDSLSKSKFLHPLSHELDFMNLRKVFEDQHNVEYYTGRDFYPNHLTLFLYEIKRKNFKFNTIKEVKFHFFQLDNWYFELSEFNRRGYNTGWLISNLFEIPETEKDKLLHFIHKEQKP